MEVRATEQRLEVELCGVPFVGIVDRVDHGPDGLVITDYKSGQPPRPAQVEEKLDQVLLYAGAVAAATGEQPTRARLLYLGATIIERGLVNPLSGLVTAPGVITNRASFVYAPTIVGENDPAAQRSIVRMMDQALARSGRSI